MEEQREESEFVGGCREPMEETGKGLGLASKTKTLDGEVDIEDADTVVVSDSGVCDVSETDENPNHGGSATEDGNTDNSVSDEKQVRVDVGNVKDTVGSGTKDSVETTIGSDDVEKTDAITEPETERNQMECDGDSENVEVKPVNRESYKSAGEEETFDSKQGNEESIGLHDPGSENKDAKHSESAQVPEEPTQLSKGETNEENPGTVLEVGSAAETCREEEITNVTQKEENEEAMEIDFVTDELVGKNVTVDNAGNESAGASMVQTQDVPIDEADRNASNVVNEMEEDERKDNANMASDPTETMESADLANPSSPTEDAAPGEVEPLDHNALFDPGSDITNFIDFSGVSSWSGNIHDLKTETGNVSLKEDKKDTDMAEGVATVETLKSVDAKVNAESGDPVSLSAEGIENESNEARVAAEFPREASDAILGSDENQEDNHECLDQKSVDQQETMKDDTTHEAPSIDPNHKEDTEMEENPNSLDYADDGTDSDIKTNGVKRKADVLSEDSPAESRKTVSFAKVSFAQRPSFKIGACIARAASQMAGSPSVLKGNNFGDETLSVESFVSQLHCAATDPVKENVVSEIAAGFFLDFRNSSASQQVTPEKVSNKRGRPSNSNAGGTEAFEFEEMGDTYWTDRVIHNGGEEQTPPTEKENYQVVPVELKPAQVKRTRRPYRRRQSQISIPLPSASDKPANFDENAPAELIMNFSETDTIPPEKSLRKMFRHFGPIRESQTEVDKENNRARVVYRKSTDAEVAYNSAGRFRIFGTKAVNYKLSYTITEAFKVEPYVVSLGEEVPGVCEDATTVEVLDSGVCDVSGTDRNPDDGGSATGDGGLKAGDDNSGNLVSDVKHVKDDVASLEDLVETKYSVEKTVSSDDVEKTVAIKEPETERNQIECEGDAGVVEVKPVNGESHERPGAEETVISGGNEVTDEKEKCEVEENGGAYDADQNVQTEKSQQSSVDGEMLSVAEDEADQEKESENKSEEEDDNKMDVDSKQANEDSVGLHENKDAKHSESAQIPEEPIQLSKGETNEENPGTVSEVSSAAEICREEEITNVNQKEEIGEAMEIDYAIEESVEKNVTVDNAGNESAGAIVVQTQDVPIAEADRNDSNVVKEMEIDERKDNANMASDLTETIESADLANPNSPTEDAAPGEVEPLDHNALFDPCSDITNFIEISGVSSWSGNIQDLKTETGNVTLKEDKKATDMAEEVATIETLKSVDAKVDAESRDQVSLGAEGIENESNETLVATDCQKEASDAILGSDENQEDNHECLDQKAVDQQDTMRKEDD